MVKDIREFYITWKGHPKYNDNIIIVDEQIRLIVNKIEMVLFTNKGDSIADYNFGADLEFFLWQTTVSTDYIRSIIIEQFNQYIPELERYNYSIDLTMTEGDFKDILLINITINDIDVRVMYS